eukprot:COSAG01_NODE_159_length_23702_cov_119.507585_2_plen_90_part_00
MLYNCGECSGGELSDGIWLPVALREKCSNTPDRDNMRPGQGACTWNYTTSTKLPGWDQMEVSIGSLPIENVTGIRYGWGGNPCCPGVNR